MSETLSEHRMAENEVIYRNANQRIVEGFEELKRVSTEDEVDADYFDPNMQLLFLCECSDIVCDKRIRITLGDFTKFHESTKCFVVFHGHNVPAIEDIIHTADDYLVVKKHEEPPTISESIKDVNS